MPLAPHVALDAPARSRRRSSAACDGDSVLGHRRRRHLERRELVDEPLDARRVGLARARGRAPARRAAPAARRPARWRRSSGARSAGGTRSARARAPRRTLPCASNSNSGSLPSRSRARRARALVAAAPRAAAARRGQRLGPRLVGRLAAGEDAIDALVVQPRVGADQRARRTPRARPARPSSSSSTVTAQRGPRPGTQRAGVVRERLRQHRLDGPRARRRSSRAGAPRGRRSEPGAT